MSEEFDAAPAPAVEVVAAAGLLYDGTAWTGALKPGCGR